MIDICKSTMYLVLLVFCLPFTGNAFADNEDPNPDIEKFAFLIGNSNHEDPFLNNISSPPNDVRKMNAKLISLGFSTTVMHDVTRASFKMEFAKFIRQVRNAERQQKEVMVLFFYAGHGIQHDKVNYLVTTDTTLRQRNWGRITSDEIKAQLISMKEVTNRLKTINSLVNLIILDACRDNPFSGSGLEVGGWADIAEKDFYVAYGTKPGYVAKENVSNGLFTAAILKHIDTSGLTLPQLFQRVRKDVAKATNGEQITQDQALATKDFYFIPPKLTDYVWQLVVSIILVSGGSIWFIYYHRKQKVSWVTGIDLTKHIVDDSPVIKEFVSRSRFQKNIRGYVKDLKRKKVVCLIYDSPLTIGRDPTCNVYLPDEEQYVSRMHCDIGWDEEKQSFWLIEPLERPSANGTYVGGLIANDNKEGKLPLGKKHYLSPGEVFYLADPNDKGWPVTIIKHKVK